MQFGQILSPMQRRPFAPGRNVVEMMFRLRRFDQQRHGVRDIRGVDPVLDARTRQNSFALLANGGRDLRVWRTPVALSHLPKTLLNRTLTISRCQSAARRAATLSEANLVMA